MKTGRTCSKMSRDSATRPRLNSVTACWASAVLSASRSPSLANSSRARTPKSSASANRPSLLASMARYRSASATRRRLPLSASNLQRGVQLGLSGRALAVPGERLPRPEVPLGHPGAEAGCASRVCGLRCEVDRRVVLAGLERLPALAQQTGDRAVGVAQPIGQFGHPAQDLRFGGPVALTVQDLLLFGEDVEPQRRVVGRHQLLGAARAGGSPRRGRTPGGPPAGPQVPGRRPPGRGPGRSARRSIAAYSSTRPAARADLGEPAGGAGGGSARGVGRAGRRRRRRRAAGRA